MLSAERAGSGDHCSPERGNKNVANGDENAGTHHVLDLPVTAGVGGKAGRIDRDEQQHAGGHADGQADNDRIEAEVDSQCADNGQAKTGQRRPEASDNGQRPS